MLDFINNWYYFVYFERWCRLSNLSYVLRHQDTHVPWPLMSPDHSCPMSLVTHVTYKSHMSLDHACPLLFLMGLLAREGLSSMMHVTFVKRQCAQVDCECPGPFSPPPPFPTPLDAHTRLLTHHHGRPCNNNSPFYKPFLVRTMYRGEDGERTGWPGPPCLCTP